MIKGKGWFIVRTSCGPHGLSIAVHFTSRVPREGLIGWVQRSSPPPPSRHFGYASALSWKNFNRVKWVMREAQITIKLFILGQVDSCVQPSSVHWNNAPGTIQANISDAITSASQSSCSDQIPFHLWVSLSEMRVNLEDTSTKRRFYSWDLNDIRFQELPKSVHDMKSW